MIDARLFIIIICLAWMGCGSDTDVLAEEGETTKKVQVQPTAKQLNLTVLLDLSDRIEPSKYPASPEHFERDIEIVRHFTQLFKSEMEERGVNRAVGKMKVIFSPRPQDSEINDVAGRLNIDLSEVSSNQIKKQVFDNIETTFVENLEDIYTKIIDTKGYVGSDIWRFFKNDVVDYAIERDTSYRNILVILTDGYLYHDDSRTVSGNRTAHLTPQSLRARGLRSTNWLATFNDRDFGYITTRDDLSQLEILVLEVSPTPDHKSDEDVIKAYLTKWFDEMGVKRYSVYNSDLPEYTKGRIDNFVAG